MPTPALDRPHAALRRASIAVVLLIGLASSGLATTQDWPQFRGLGGRAVAPDVHMPSDFGPQSAQLAWRVPVRGSGASSPVVSDGRVYLTSAYQGEERSKINGWTTGIMFACAALALLGLAAGLLRRRAADHGEPPPTWLSLLRRLDGLAVSLTALGCILLFIVATVAPERLWTPGLPGDAWLVTGTVGLAGGVAAFGAFRPGSVARLIGVAVLPLAALLVLRDLPLNKHREVFKLTYRIALCAPAIAGAAWFLMLYFVHRKRSMMEVARSTLLIAPAMAVMATVQFANTNYLSPRAGLARSLMCLDLVSGELLWDLPLFVAAEERLHRQNSFATPTPCVAGDRVFAYFGPGYACVSTEGEVLWEGRDETYIENSRYGCVTSPIPFEDTFIINQENEQELRASYIMALDQASGELRWRVEPKYAHDSYMTPSIVMVGDSAQLVTVSMALAAAFDARSGDLLWKLDLPTWQHAPSITYEGDRVFISGGAHVKWVTAALSLRGTDRGGQPKLLWKTTKSVPPSSSPVLYGGVYVTATDLGILCCFEPETGELLWRERIDGSVLASLTGCDGKILICTAEGGVLVIEAGPQYRLLSRADLGEMIRATPAMADGRVLVRTETQLYCYLGDAPPR